MPTANTYIYPSDGWTLIATTPAFIRVTAFPHTHPYYIAAASSTPASTVIGTLICHKPFWMNVATGENIYARTANPVPNSSTRDGKLRLDIITVAGSGAGGGGGGGGASGTGTLSQVASSATAVTILAANTNRKGASIYNASTQVLYLGLSGTTPTSSVYTVAMAAGSYYEAPAGYNGIIKGIWASANGQADVTEFT